MTSNKLRIFLIFVASVLFVFRSDAVQLPKILEYRLDLRIDFNTEKLYGKCEITISNDTNQPIVKIPVLLYRLLSIKNVENENNMSLPFTQNVVSIAGWEKLQVNFIEISLSKMLDPGEQRKIKMDYEGYLLGYSEAGWLYVKDHINKNFTIIRTDGFGYPLLGYPNDRDMMAIVKERYDYLINITVPNGLIVASGGELIDQTETDNETTYVFRSKIPSWRLDIAISDYQILEKGKNKVFYFADDSLGAQRILNALKTSLELYTSWFVPLDDYQGFTIIEIPEGYGSQQDITCILITADNFKKSKEMLTIYHEVAHLWNVKHLDDQPSRFESEGFAQFLQYLLSEKLDKKENAVSEAAQRYLNRIRNTFIEKQEYQTIPIKDYGIQDMTSYSYTLGMVVFAILFDLVGQDHFNKMIGSFYSAYYSKGATLDEFINHCQKCSPVDLKRFFNDWIYSTKGIELVVEGKTFKELIHYYKNNEY